MVILPTTRVMAVNVDRLQPARPDSRRRSTAGRQIKKAVVEWATPTPSIVLPSATRCGLQRWRSQAQGLQQRPITCIAGKKRFHREPPTPTDIYDDSPACSSRREGPWWSADPMGRSTDVDRLATAHPGEVTTRRTLGRRCRFACGQGDQVVTAAAAPRALDGSIAPLAGRV